MNASRNEETNTPSHAVVSDAVARESRCDATRSRAAVRCDAVARGGAMRRGRARIAVRCNAVARGGATRRADATRRRDRGGCTRDASAQVASVQVARGDAMRQPNTAHRRAREESTVCYVTLQSTGAREDGTLNALRCITIRRRHVTHRCDEALVRHAV